MIGRYMFTIRMSLSNIFVARLVTWHPSVKINPRRVQLIFLWLTPKDPKRFGYLRKILLILHMSLIIGSKHLSWYLNSGCSWHMIEERCVFQWLTPYHGAIVTFRGKQKGRITRVGKIIIHPDLSIDNVLFVEGLKHNLLSISQLCDSEYSVFFNKYECVVLWKDKSPLFSAKRKGNLYQIKLGDLTDQTVSCLLSVKESH